MYIDIQLDDFPVYTRNACSNHSSVETCRLY